MSKSLLALLFMFEAAKCGSFANRHISVYIIVESDLVLCKCCIPTKKHKTHETGGHQQLIYDEFQFFRQSKETDRRSHFQKASSKRKNKQQAVSVSVTDCITCTLETVSYKCIDN